MPPPHAATGTDGRITILVSHRFSTVRMADLIVVLDGARLVEVGTHDELLARADNTPSSTAFRQRRIGEPEKHVVQHATFCARSQQPVTGPAGVVTVCLMIW